MFTGPLQRGSAPAWPSLTDRRRTHPHTHTHTDRHRRDHRDNVGEVEPLQGTRRPLAEAARTCENKANGGLAEEGLAAST